MLKNFLLRMVINAFALAVVVTVLPQHIHIVGSDRQNEMLILLGIALIFGLVNAIVKPILTFLTCPFILFTLGLFLLVINGLMFMLTAELSRLVLGGAGLVVESFPWAMAGALIMSIIGVVSEKIFGLDDRVKVKTVREVRYVYRDRGDFGEPPDFPPPYPDDAPYTPPGDKPKRR
ncbi:MAG: phage holin family protein [Chloroflexota bacterium]|nr:MAG: phage holin family protein [Chloroflexota bacterium]